jgi:AraC family transcriptional regulator, exoenzyme S synthesis regulatory protein ExsA
LNDKIYRVPREIRTDLKDHNVLRLKGLYVIGAYTQTQKVSGTLFLEDHLLLFVQEGKFSVSHGENIYIVNKNEMVLLNKAIVIQYQKFGDAEKDNLMSYKMFFLSDEILREFSKTADIRLTELKTPVPVSVRLVNERLAKYLESLDPYFHDEKVDKNLIKIKLMELLYDLTAMDTDLMYQLLQLKQLARSDIPKIVDENILNPVSVSDLAYLSGRSLSSFKREFQSIYNMSPHQWIRERRLDRAKELLMNTSISVTDICFMTGFENTTHFSRIFKERYGCAPITYKRKFSFQ